MEKEVSNRNFLKRKMPEYFDDPLILKSHVFSRTISHSHTTSLPIETPACNHNKSHLVETFSDQNCKDLKRNANINELNIQKNSNLINKLSNKHEKTFSLPTETQNNIGEQYPSYNYNINYIPLPNGWKSEKTANGKTYFIE
jgi:hypothetical protein